MTTEAEPEATATSTASSWVRRNRWVLAALGVVVVFNIVVLHGELRAAAFPNQSGVHESMVRWAGSEWSEGRVPLDGWWPYLSAGLPQFHQAESAPQIVTSLAGLGVGANAAYRIVLFLLLVLWPLALYAAMRIAEADRLTALCVACIGSLVVSWSGIGYEHGAYVWAGRGYFAQLWGMWLLPFAWATCWRAVRGRLNPAWAAAATGTAFVCHFALWPYLLLGLAVPALVHVTGLLWRCVRAVVVGLGATAVASWALVPLVADLRWANQSAYLVRQADVDAPSFLGAFTALVTGEVYDAARVPVLTALVAVGLVVCVRNARNHHVARALLGLWVGSVVLWASWPLAGSLFGSLAGGSGTTPPQVLVGVHLSGLLLAGAGLAAVASLLRRPAVARYGVHAATALVAALAAVVLAPAWVERGAYALDAGSLVKRQQQADEFAGRDVERLVTLAEADGPGRIWAFGDTTVGDVPLSEWLLGIDADAVGNLLKTSSISSDPEALVEGDDPDALTQFGVRHMIGPSNAEPPQPGTMLGTAGSLAMWRMQFAPGYVRAIGGNGPPIEMDRTDVGVATREAYVGGARGIAWRVVSFDGAAAGPTTVGSGAVTPEPPGSVAVTEDLAGGNLAVDATMSRRAYVAVSVSMHGRWHTTVDGAEEPVWMLAPSFFGVVVEPGRHSVVFEYRRIGWYPWLFLVGAIALAALWAVGRRSRRAGPPAEAGGPGEDPSVKKTQMDQARS